ncbi:MAG: hypothetical protein ACMVY4_11515 [Minwuia sp.]|uniref:hypothetical protein n=1 Tax=Minwuia sp. TaxID=2493630 RepID=UPI003A87F161
MVDSKRATPVAFPFNTYTHTPQEAAQYINYCLGRLFVQPALASIVFGRERITPTTWPFAAMVSEIDLFVVEISSVMQLSACGLEMQSNYFSANLIRHGGRPYLDWWRAVTIESSDRIEISDSLIHSIKTSNTKGIEPWREELLLTTKYREMDINCSDAAMKSLIKIQPSRFLFVSHFDLPGADSLNIRRKIAEHVGLFCSGQEIPWFDPTPLVAKIGRTNALKGGGKDIYHYESGFESIIGEHLLNKCADAMQTKRPASMQNRTENPLQKLYRPSELYDMPLDMLRTLLTRQDLPESVREFIGRRLLELAPFDEIALASVAKAAISRNLPVSALVYSNRALELNPNNNDASSIRLQAMTELGAGDHEDHLDEAIERDDPKALARVCLLIRSLYQQSEPIRRRIDDLVAERVRHADELEQEGDLAAACRRLTELRELDPRNGDRWKRRADELHRQVLKDLRDLTLAGKNGEAATLARSMISAHLSLSTAYDTLGRVAVADGDLNAAEQAFRCAIAEAADDPISHLNLARVLGRRGEIAAAAEALVHARDLLEDTDKIAAFREAKKSLRALATPLVQKGREIENKASDFEEYLDAFRYYKLASSEMSTRDLDGWSSNLRRTALLDVLRRYREEAATFEEAAIHYLMMAPKDKRVLGMLAHFISSSRRHEEAIPYWEQLLKIDPTDANVFLQLARCYQRLAMREPMQEAVKHALALDPNNSVGRELLEKVSEVDHRDLE